MKYKNYKSAIHNFAQSFQSIDWMKSPKLAINTLILLNNLDILPKVRFDFISESIFPNEAITNSSQMLLSDYKDWLPEHFKKRNCDLDKLELLQIEISGKFQDISTLKKREMNIEVIISSITKWKVAKKDVQIIEISEIETLNREQIKNGFPEFK